MKQNFRKLIRSVIYALLLIALGCSHDDTQDKQEHLHEGALVKLVPFEELVKQSRFNAAFKKLQKENSSIGNEISSRTVMEQEYGFTIEDTPAKVIENDSMISYTLLIGRPTFDAESFENLVLQVNKFDESIIASILKYNLTSPIVTSAHSSSSSTYNVEATPIVYNASDANAKTGTGCFMVLFHFCDYGGSQHFAGPKCQNTYPVSVEICIDGSSGGGNTGGGNTSGGSTSGGSTTGGNTTGGNTTSGNTSGGSASGGNVPSPGTPNTGNIPGQSGGGGGNSGGTVVTSTVTMTPAMALTARKKAFSQKLRGLNLLVGFNELPENTQGEIWNFLESSLTNGEFTVIATLYPEEVVEFVSGLIEDCENQNLNNQDAHEYIVSNIIEEQIDDSQLDDCTKGVLNQLKNLQQNDISKIFRNINSPYVNSTVYKTTINVAVPNNPLAFANSNWDQSPPFPSNSTLPFNYVINLNPSYLNGTMTSPPKKPTKLSIARTILHEIIHVYFDSLFDDCVNLNNCVAIKEFPELWNFYVAHTSGGSTSITSHVAMANLYTDFIARALQEFQTGVAVPNNEQPQQVYVDLAWQGLAGSLSNPNPAFIQLYPLGTPQRERFDNVNNAEDHQQSFYQVSSISQPCN